MDEDILDTPSGHDILKKSTDSPTMEQDDYLKHENHLSIHTGDEKEPTLTYKQPYLLINRHFGASIFYPTYLGPE